MADCIHQLTRMTILYVYQDFSYEKTESGCCSTYTDVDRSTTDWLTFAGACTWPTDGLTEKACNIISLCTAVCLLTRKQNANKAIIDGRLRPRCATRDEHLLVFILEWNVVEISAAMLVVFYRRLRIQTTRRSAITWKRDAILKTVST